MVEAPVSPINCPSHRRPQHWHVGRRLGHAVHVAEGAHSVLGTRRQRLRHRLSDLTGTDDQGRFGPAATTAEPADEHGQQRPGRAEGDGGSDRPRDVLRRRVGTRKPSTSAMAPTEPSMRGRRVSRCGWMANTGL
jgi:hypothetical protein